MKSSDTGMKAKYYYSISYIAERLKLNEEEIKKIILKNPKLPRCAKGGGKSTKDLDLKDLSSWKYPIAAIRNLKNGLV